MNEGSAISDLTPFTGCINWQAYDTNAIWQVLKDEDEAKGYTGVVSWHATGSYLDIQEQRLRAARDALAAVWPPEKNESARGFLQEMERALLSMSETRNAAANIRAGLDGIVSGLAEARTEVRGQLAHRMDAADDIAPRWFDHAEDEIDAQVRQTMAQKEQLFAEHASKIQAPEPFQVNLAIFSGGTETGSTGAGPGSPGTTGGSNQSGGGYRPVPVHIPHDPPAPRPGHDPFAPGSGGSPGGTSAGGISGGPDGSSTGQGPSLEGARPSTGRGTGDGHDLSPSAPAADGLSDAFMPGLIAGGMGASALGNLFDRPGSLPVPSASQAVAVRTGMPSGSVIGGSPAGANTSGRPNAMMPGMQGGRGRQGDNDDAVDRDPTNLWAADEGVAPVIGPDDRVVRHDAGMNVIGWNQ